MTLREIITKIGFQVDQKGADEAEDRVKKMSLGMKAAIGGVIAGIATIGKKALDSAGDMEMLTTQFEVMLGSAEAAEDMMSQLQQFAASTPFALNDLAKGTQQLLSFGVSAEDVVDRMRMLGDTAGGDAEKLSGLILAFGKVQTKGKASLEEINMMAERGLPIFDVLAAQLNTTKENLFKMISAGKVSAEDMTQAFRTMTSEGGMFFKGMEKQSLTFQGLVSTMKDNISLMLASVGKVLLPTAKLVVNTITELVQGPIGELVSVLIEALNPIIETLAGLLENVVKAILPLSKVLKAIVPWITTILKIFESLGPVLDIVTFLLNMIGDILTSLSDPINDVLNLLVEMTNMLVRILSEELLKAFKPIGDIFKSLSGVIGEVMKAFMPVVKLFARIIGMKIAFQIKMILLPFILFARLLNKIIVPLTKVIDLLMQFLSPAISAISVVLNNMMDNTISFLDLLKFLFTWLATALLNLAKGIGEGLWGVIQDVFNRIGEKLSAIGMRVKTVVDFIGSVVKAFWDWLGERFPWLTKLINKIGEIFSGVWEKIGETFRGVWDAIIGSIQTLIGWVNKIPGVDFKLPDFGGTPGSAGAGTAGEFAYFIEGESTPAFNSPSMGDTTKNANTTIDSKIEVNVPAGSDAKAVATAVEDAVKSVFTLELKKILVDAGY